MEYDPSIATVSKETFEELRHKVAIRKLTPEECFILQGMTPDDVQKCRDVGISDSSLYKEAGNGLTTNCVQFIMEHLRKAHVEAYKTTDEAMVERYGAIE